jgi:hypothetical protein
VSAETFMAGGYALALIGSSFALEWLAAHTSRRALRFRTAGFHYNAVHDHWVCPENEHLWPYEIDQERRLVRYRARAQVCNACRLKERCTDSNEGRELVRPLDPWPRSEAGRFHRVISIVLVVLGVLVMAVELARHHRLQEAALAGAVMLAGALALRWLARDLRAHPADAPPPLTAAARIGEAARR